MSDLFRSPFGYLSNTSTSSSSTLGNNSTPHQSGHSDSDYMNGVGEVVNFTDGDQRRNIRITEMITEGEFSYGYEGVDLATRAPPKPPSHKINQPVEELVANLLDINLEDDENESTRSCRPQNFYNLAQPLIWRWVEDFLESLLRRKIKNRRPCLWGCGNYFSKHKMEEHVSNLCPRRNEVREFEKAFNEDELVAVRHPNGRPKLKTPEEEFEDQIREEEAKEAMKREIRRPYLDRYFMEHFGQKWSK